MRRTNTTKSTQTILTLISQDNVRAEFNDSTEKVSLYIDNELLTIIDYLDITKIIKVLSKTTDITNPENYIF